MTKEEAIDIIKCLAWHTIRPDEEDIEQAIKALEQEPRKGEVILTKEECIQENNELYKKIDNAIDEIEDLEKIELSLSDLGGNVGNGWFVCIDEVLEIIKSILGK